MNQRNEEPTNPCGPPRYGGITRTWKDEGLNEATNDNHLGHLFMNYMQLDPDAIFQMDASSGEQESRRSVWSRSVRLALALRQLGLQPGDTVVLSGRNHLHVHIPLYACILNGLPLAGVDPLYKYNEIMQLFKTVAPKVAFCEHEMYEDYIRAARDLRLSTKVLVFNAGVPARGSPPPQTMTEFMDSYRDLQSERQFKVATFDVSKVPCWLMSTSGTTGVPKVVAHSHTVVLQRMLDILRQNNKEQICERKFALNLSPIHWGLGYFNALLMPVHYVKLQSAAATTAECIINVINEYKPVIMIITPTTIAAVLRDEKMCDLSCFDLIRLGGAKAHLQTLRELRDRVRSDCKIVQGYGLLEIGAEVFQPCPEGPLGNLGVPRRQQECKLIDPDSGRIVLEPHIAGELWIRGPRMECYYNNPEATSAVLTEDGFLKTGDIMYRDENGYYFFVERQKMLFKYKGYQVVPPEIEAVLLTHPGVADVCVSSVPHPADDERAVACVVRRRGAHVTAQDLKNFVASELSVYKHLHGGVVFVDELPLTSNGKINRNKVKEIVMNAERQ